jgi:pimeloyl-ACP methyl ester carboxylesterase
MKAIATPTIKSVELPNRVTLQYVEQGGDPSGVPVVLLHGVTDSWRSFEPVLPRLPESIHAFALTQRGHGDAARPASGYRPRDFAADLAAFMDALNLGQAVIAGHSMGSYAAQRFAMDHPECTLGLVLMGSFTNWRDNPVVAEFWEDALSKLADPIDPEFMREFQGSPLMEPAFLETVVWEALKVPARVWREAWKALMDTDHSGELGKIEAPTLIVWGDQDELIPRSEQDALAAAIASSRLEVYPGIGHGLHWDAPERFANDLVAFVENIAAGQAKEALLDE